MRLSPALIDAAMVKALEQMQLDRRILNSHRENNMLGNGHPVSTSCSSMTGRRSPRSTRRSAVSSSNREQDPPGAHCEESMGLNLTMNESKVGGGGGGWECLAVYISPDLGERIMLSGERNLIEEVFPEIAAPLMDARTSVAWNQDPRHVIRFPLNGYCKLNSMQAITRLLNADFRIVASSGGGVEGQQFSEYLFIRKTLPL